MSVGKIVNEITNYIIALLIVFDLKMKCDALILKSVNNTFSHFKEVSVK
jgi:hypothetical protein